MKKRMRQKRGRLFSPRKPLFALMTFIFLSYSTAVSADTDNTIRLLRSGTWGLEANPNLFGTQKLNPEKNHPAVVYIPPRTIIFRSEESPKWLPHYIKVQLHYGHWVHINKIYDSHNILAPISKWIEQLPSKTILIHRPLFCLDQTNLLAPPGTKCKQGFEPLGKGWISTFKEDSQTPESFWNLTINPDEKTKEQIAARGWHQDWTEEFRVATKDIQDLEKNGDITVLDKTHPRVEFEYKRGTEIFIRCGTTEISEEDLRQKSNIKTKAGVEAKLPRWFSWIGGQFGIDIRNSTEQNKREGRKTNEINTTEKSSLFYVATMTRSGSNKTSDILVEKTFECESSPRAQPGRKILTVKFHIFTPGENDKRVFQFTEPEDYLAMPEEIYDHHHRPIFLSINSVKQYDIVLKEIMSKYGTDVNLAHFMLSNMNTTCHGNQRERCAEIIEKELQSKG